MKRKRLAAMAGTGVAAIAALVAVLSSAGVMTAGDSAGRADTSVLSLYGVATVVHTGADGAVLGTQEVHNQLVDSGENFILQQVFRDGTSEADPTQIGAICLSADDMDVDADKDAAELLTAQNFNDNHQADYTQQGGSGLTPSDTRECLTDIDVSMAGQVATVGPLTFVANSTQNTSNWIPGETAAIIGVCKASSTAAAQESCVAPLFAVVDINDVTLEVGETLTVTYTFDMTSGTT